MRSILARAVVVGAGVRPEPRRVLPPPNGLPQIVDAPPTSPIHWVRMTYSDARPPSEKAFWSALAWLPDDWAWLVLYVAAYIPALFVTRSLLGVA